MQRGRLSFLNPTSPAELFGGSWERIKGKFLLGSDYDDTTGTATDYAVGGTGGSTSHAHYTSVGFDSGYMYLSFKSDWNPYYGSTVITMPAGTSMGLYAANSSTNKLVRLVKTGNTNNMPPYLVVYIWRRLS